MNSLDTTIVASFLIITLGIGFYFSRRGSKNMEGYFNAGKSLPWWVIGMASVATYSSAGTGAAFTMLVYNGGIMGNWWWWLPWVIMMPLVAIIWAKLWRRLGIATAAEVIQIRYSGRVSKIFRSFYALFFASLYATISLGYGTGWLFRTLGPILGWSNLEIMMVAGIVVLIYTVLSGLYGVVYNDVVQFMVFLIGNLIFIPIVIKACGGWEHIVTQATQLRGAEFFKPLPPGGDLTRITIFALVLQGLFFAQSPSGGEGHMAQRFLSAKSEVHAVVGQLLNGFLSLALRALPFIVLGIVAASLFPLDSIAPGEIWGQMVKGYAVPGILGLLVAAELSAYMSTVSAQMNWGASYFVNDIYRSVIKKNASDRHYIWVSRILSFLILVFGFCIAYFEVGEMMEWFLFINSVVLAFVLPICWLRFFWHRMNIYGEVVAILGGIPLGYLVWFPLGFSQRPFWQGFLLLFALGWVVIVGTVLLTRPEKTEVLQNFYKRCKPPGLWGPVTDCLSPEERRLIRKNTMTDILNSIIGIFLFGSLVTSINAFFASNWILLTSAIAILIVTGYLLVQRLSRDKVFSSLGNKPLISGPTE